MNKSEKFVVRVVAFLFSTVVSVSAFALFSSWAWTRLDPAQQDTIGAINTPWIPTPEERTLAIGEQGHAPGGGNAKPEAKSTTVAHAR
jgi:hypothetical protein